MESEYSYLKNIVGKAVSKIEMNTSTTFAIGKNDTDQKNQRMEIGIGVSFEDYYLEIYNPVEIIPSDKELINFIGLTVIATSEEKKQAEVVFDNGYKIIVNMQNEVYYGPEAMCLSGPNNFWVVWN